MILSLPGICSVHSQSISIVFKGISCRNFARYCFVINNCWTVRLTLYIHHILVIFVHPALPGDVKINTHPSSDPAVGEKLTISVASNSTSRRSFVSCTFSRGQNCSEISYPQLLYNSSDPAKPSALGQHRRFHVIKRSAVDFDIVFDMASKEHTGCYACQEFFMKQQSSGELNCSILLYNIRIWNRNMFIIIKIIIL